MSKEIFEKFTMFVTGAFTFVAALAWNSAITSLINKYIKPGDNTLSLFIYAVVVTLIAVIVISLMSKIVKKNKK